MNKLFCYVVLLCSFFGSYAQRKSQQQIDPSQIPAAVRTSQQSNFPYVQTVRWEIRDLMSSRKFITKYVAVFDVESNAIRARYKGDGTLVSSSKFFNSEQAPGQIKNLGGRFNDYKLKSAEEIKTYTKGKLFYRGYFFKGKKRLVAYVDDNGKELTEEKVPAEVKEDEEADN